MSERTDLPQRRSHLVLDFIHNDVKYTLGVGHYKNEPMEIFLSSSKAGSDLDVNARDAAIAASIALQFGASPKVLLRSMTRNADGSMSGPLGVALNKIVKEQI
jgi:ribonucleoside-diphosphate reductase alpha chain